MWRRGTAVLSLTALVGLFSAVIVPADRAKDPGRPVQDNTSAIVKGLAACPWLANPVSKGVPPSELAAVVVGRMTLTEKLGELVLRSDGPYENVNAGVPRLCIPQLTLQDGPSGIAYRDRGVTQLPAPLGLAASFDPAVARQYGQVLGQEASGQGIDVVQAPNLNIDRVPQSGQGFTGFGEDPLLVSMMGAAEIRGIQSQGAMADAKHLAVYSQETNRMSLDDSVSQRAIQEIYAPPFRSAVAAGVASVMCAYPELNGTLQCQDPSLDQALHDWGFTGFVRSDQWAVHDPAAALNAGTDLLKPGSVPALAAAVARGTLSVATVNNDVQKVLTQMFAYGDIGRPRAGVPGKKVDTSSHSALALSAAQRSIVLLRNRGNILPLSKVRSVAVIGAPASDAPVTGGHGSSQVIAPFVSVPLAALKSGLGPGVAVKYVDAASTTRALPPIPAGDLTPTSGQGHGLTLTVDRQGAGASLESSRVIPSAAASVTWEAPSQKTTTAAKSAGSASSNLSRLAAQSSGSQIYLSKAGSRVSLTGTLQVPRSGLYSLSLEGAGPMKVSVDSSAVVDERTNQGFGNWSGTVYLVAGHRYPLSVDWVPVNPGDGMRTTLAIGMADASEAITTAVKAARSAQVAIVFAADYSGETFDRPNLSLPGDQDALISAVAAANPRTVVVLNTSGPVLMPWINQVSSVLEAWYSGEEDGAAIASVLLGTFNPSGHLPVTFPANTRDSAISTEAQWPGTQHVSSYTEGLDVGYRYYNQTGKRPLFPFGFGLSYTTFAFSKLSVAAGSADVNVSVTVTNTGHRSGGDVVQAYLTYPTAAHEPPGQLVAFAPVNLTAGQSARVAMTIPSSELRSYQGSAWTVVPGQYRFGVGDSSESQPLHGTFAVPPATAGHQPSPKLASHGEIVTSHR
jgi:beta-glucosidase